jgi:hypothetical protein
MVMMILYDFDKTIEQLEDVSSAFQKAKRNQQELAFHPYTRPLHENDEGQRG